MLKKMNFFKRRRSNKPSVTGAGELDEQFAKVNTTKSSLGDSKDTTLGRPAGSLEELPGYGSSTDQRIAWDAFDRPAQSSVPSLASDRSCAITSPSPAPTVQPLYEIYALPEPTVSGEISSRHSCDSFDEPEPTLDTSTSFLLDATPPRTRRRYTESAAKPEAGLKALFETPSHIEPHPRSSPSEPAPLHSRPNNSGLFGPPLEESAYASPNITSHQPLVSESFTAHELPSDAEVQTTQVRAPPVKPLFILTPPQTQSDVKPSRRLDVEAKRKTEDEPSPSQKIALAQVFMYQARMTNQPAYNTKTTSAITDDGISFESKPSGLQLSPSARAGARRPRSVSTSSIRATPNTLLSYDNTIVPRPLQAGFMISELDGSVTKGNAVDSEAWRRKSKMLQSDSFGYHIGVVA
ncbi:uncharacterized protein F4807DRAFT_438708 [Annulohypoxylon truncatum]|uniref:uncharacterized protein n=1 Tax=Annulohypoxylon truncatum TaxID=327061 RepID=UPI00200721D3|nr:uncharacterized protein F4807DRAFT_438708 [Annulohypoxylon truncatum]KAI1206619.1 hypothetical protein F4807DRAFT_438708 [Annulohypoxylon truncatum]